MAELLSDPDLAYSHGQTCIYFIISDLYFADDGSLKTTVCFFDQFQYFSGLFLTV